MPKTIAEQYQEHPDFTEQAARYLIEQLLTEKDFLISPEAADLYLQFEKTLKQKKALKLFRQSLQDLKDVPAQQMELARNWLFAFLTEAGVADAGHVVNETALLLITEDFDKARILQQSTKATLKNLHGEHSRVEDGNYHLDFHSFFRRLEHFEAQKKPQFEAFTRLKKELVTAYRKQMRLEEFKPRVLSSFIRNKLTDQVYLPLIGSNLSKQIGTAGQSTRTDRMGLLLLISPPGYGKTTLMEYIANKLGLIFMKINGPAIGHQVTSLDPEDASNRAAAQELEKLNLSFEMGDNVMIYLDDIQHCNPEFLQKFISLCDAQRKIEGVWKSHSKTYDFRGKRVCVVMAGNPYTESGAKFKIPDMLANRADIYNLGDIIGDNEDVFKLSYIENALTSNPVLAALAGKSMADVYSIIEVATGSDRNGMQLEANHTPEELNDYVSVLKKMLLVRDVVLSVNQQYILSAAMNDDYRTEPPFKLQGSYRNMNKLAARIVPIMNEEEIQTALLSHYEGEAQTLTTGAESNFLKLKEMLGVLNEEEERRWNEIKETYQKNKIFNQVDANHPVSQLVAQMSRFSDGIDGIKKVLESGLEKT